jgi:hypothetical protein
MLLMIVMIVLALCVFAVAIGVIYYKKRKSTKKVDK